MLTIYPKFFIDNAVGLVHIERSFAINSTGAQRVGHLILLKRKDVITMVCATLREGHECVFMTKRGCEFNGGRCHTIVEQCDGCQRIVEYPTGKFCMNFPDPSTKWKNGICNMATHVKRNHTADNHKLNPLKASKRAH
jgi:hypothetical protein